MSVVPSVKRATLDVDVIIQHLRSMIPEPTTWCNCCAWVDDEKLFRSCFLCSAPVCLDCVLSVATDLEMSFSCGCEKVSKRAKNEDSA